MKRRTLAATLGALFTLAPPALALEPPAPEPTAPFDLVGFGQLFTGYGFESGEGQSFNEFRLERAELGLGLVGTRTFIGDVDYGFMLNVEAIRSAGSRSLFGIDNDSLVFRAKHAFGYFEPDVGSGTVRIRAGLIPDTWVATVESNYDLRGVAPTTSERGEFFDTSDLGAEVGYSHWNDMFAVRVSMTNGEGRNQRELNEGKNLTAVVSLSAPTFELFGQPTRIAAHGTWRDGSIGPSSRRNQRAAGALTLANPRLFVGAEFVRAFGYLGRGDQEAQGVGAWANGSLYFPWLGAYARFELDQTDLEVDDSSVTRIGAGLYVDAIDAGDRPRDVLGFPRLRLYLGYQNESFGPGASTVAGAPEASNTNAFDVTLSARANVRTQSVIEPSRDELAER